MLMFIKVRTLCYLRSHKQRTMSDIPDRQWSRSDTKLTIAEPHPAELLHDGPTLRLVVRPTLPFFPQASVNSYEVSLADTFYPCMVKVRFEINVSVDVEVYYS